MEDEFEDAYVLTFEKKKKKKKPPLNIPAHPIHHNALERIDLHTCIDDPRGHI
jgi:hypothetical protein